MKSIVAAFDLHRWTLEDAARGRDTHIMPKSVKEADDLLLRTEMRDLMPEGVLDTIPGETLEGEIVCWTPEQAKHWFMERYREISTGKKWVSDPGYELPNGGQSRKW